MVLIHVLQQMLARKPYLEEAPTDLTAIEQANKYIAISMEILGGKEVQSENQRN